MPTALQQRFNGKPSWPHLALVGVLLAGFLLLLVPTVLTLFRQVWQTDEQGHGPIIGAVSLWLMWRQRQAVIDAPVRPVYVGGGLLFNGTSSWVPIQGEPRNMSQLSREQVKKETVQFLKTHRFSEGTQEYVLK